MLLSSAISWPSLLVIFLRETQIAEKEKDLREAASILEVLFPFLPSEANLESFRKERPRGNPCFWFVCDHTTHK